MYGVLEKRVEYRPCANVFTAISKMMVIRVLHQLTTAAALQDL